MLMWILLGAAVLVAVVGAIVWLVRRRNRNDGPISIVMFRTTPRRLTEADVRSAYRRALKHEPKVERVEFDEHTYAFLLVAEELPPLAVVDSARTYFEPEDLETIAGGLENPESRRAMLESKAWVSVDAMGVNATLKREQREMIYTLLAPVAANLIDDACTLLYQPAERRAAPADGVGGRSEQLLRENKIAELFGDNDMLTPVYSVERSDARVNKAIEEARRRIPEFCSAWEARGTAGQPLVKGRFATDDEDGAEYMWISVSDMTDAGFVGVVENNPLAEGLPAKGETVTVKLDDVVDWAYLDENEQPHGMFVDRVLTGG